MEKEMSLPMTSNQIDEVRMEPAVNGVIICYTEKKKRLGQGDYDNYSYDYKKEVFDFDEEEDVEKAFMRFRELSLHCMKKKK